MRILGRFHLAADHQDKDRGIQWKGLLGKNTFHPRRREGHEGCLGNKLFLVMAVEIHPLIAIFSFSAGERKVMKHSFEKKVETDLSLRSK